VSTELEQRPSDAGPETAARPRRVAPLLVGALLAPVLLIVGGIAFTSGAPAPDAGQTAGPIAAGQTTVSGDQAAVIAALEDRVDRLPADHAAWASLGFAYLGQARATADPSFYARAERALARSLEVRPEDNADALAGQAALAGSRHDFARSRDLALLAVEVDPYDSTARGVLADAQLELGEYDAAAATLQEMVDLRPGVPSFTRMSYAFELRGETEQAQRLLQRALDMASTPADSAFCLYHLGRLSAGVGEHEVALQRYDEGLALVPDDVELLSGRATSLAALGRDTDAAETWAEVVQRRPQPGYLVEYAELLQSIGRGEEAADQLAVAETVRTLFDEAGVVPDIEVALHEADHGDPSGRWPSRKRTPSRAAACRWRTRSPGPSTRTAATTRPWCTPRRRPPRAPGRHCGTTTAG
jgi:tetratricopeptide (TPR) repeat protein